MACQAHTNRLGLFLLFFGHLHLLSIERLIEWYVGIPEAPVLPLAWFLPLGLFNVLLRCLNLLAS